MFSCPISARHTSRAPFASVCFRVWTRVQVCVSNKMFHPHFCQILPKSGWIWGLHIVVAPPV